MKKSQTWSIDIMVAILAFIGTIFVFYAIFAGNQESTAEDLEKDASKVLKGISSEDSGVGIMDGIEVDEAKLQQLLGEDYSTIKEKMRVDKDFCIFLEDEEGNIIYVSNKPGIGSDKIMISDVPCD